MNRRPYRIHLQEGRLDWSELTIEAIPSPEPRYAASAIAARCGVHIQTVISYERYGVIEPAATEKGPPLYSDADVDRVLRVRRLIDDLGVNLAGAAAIIQLREQLVALQRELVAVREAHLDPDQ
jgi:MerR family transcriptional regulator/heat shock protein HspR